MQVDVAPSLGAPQRRCPCRSRKRGFCCSMKAIYPTISATLFSAASSSIFGSSAKKQQEIILQQVHENTKDATHKRTLKR
jgi:hypothetical protein